MWGLICLWNSTSFGVMDWTILLRNMNSSPWQSLLIFYYSSNSFKIILLWLLVLCLSSVDFVSLICIDDLFLFLVEFDLVITRKCNFIFTDNICGISVLDIICCPISLKWSNNVNHCICNAAKFSSFISWSLIQQTKNICFVLIVLAIH